MKINHKKLNVVLGLVVILVTGWLVVSDRNIVKKHENVISEDNEKSEVVNSSNTKLDDLKYKNFTVEVFNVAKQFIVEDIVNMSDKSRHKNKYEKFTIGKLETVIYKYNNRYQVKGLIERHGSVGMMRADGDVIYISIFDMENQEKIVDNFKIIIYNLSCESECGWLDHFSTDKEIEDIMGQLLAREGY